MNIIQTELSESNTILISHNDSVRDKFDQVLEFKKINNFSGIKK
jgi:hypothetical protein